MCTRLWWITTTRRSQRGALSVRYGSSTRLLTLGLLLRALWAFKTKVKDMCLKWLESSLVANFFLFQFFFAHTFPNNSPKKAAQTTYSRDNWKKYRQIFIRYCWLKSRHIECIPRPASCCGKMWFSSFFYCIKFCCGFPDVDISTSSEWRKRVFGRFFTVYILFGNLIFAYASCALAMCIRIRYVIFCFLFFR